LNKIVLVLISFGISISAFATEITATTKIGEIWSGYANGQILFKTVATHINPKPCDSNGFYAVDATKADADKFLSMLLTAQSRDADVQIRISLTECLSGYPVALRMAIKP